MSYVDPAHLFLSPKKQLALTTATAYDFTAVFAPYARRIYCGPTGGTVYVKMIEDAVAVPRTVIAGAFIDGIIVAITADTACVGMIAEQ